MILINGEILDTSAEETYLEGLYDKCLQTLNKESTLTPDKVIAACDTLYHMVEAGKFETEISQVLHGTPITHERFWEMARLFTKENMTYKCQIELGEDFHRLPDLNSGIRRKYYPLGILFHIAAGNVDGLPAYSVIEGLLTGNINILKLPAGDNGLSIFLLNELIKIEPDIKEYIYVFDVPSADTKSMKMMADIADGIVVWGGDEAVQAVRTMADVRTKIIDWGHKLSFAYVTEKAADMELYRLALHVCESNQVYCSSCQGIFVDTDDPEVLHRMGERFIKHMLNAQKVIGEVPFTFRGQNTIKLYTDMLEINRKDRILQAEGVSVVIKEDRELELSYMFRNVWIKALPHQEIFTCLKKHKRHLQTCGLICAQDERRKLTDLLAKAGVVRITGGNMSRSVAGEAHDGTYPLREYCRMVEY